ncbi:MAG TPA: ABC transporter substrate-binding protein [Streptosporangiaceae bacterium]|nr:ABC transporter substrate-binding protein [Streptosporangiaceae bacterium]
MHLRSSAAALIAVAAAVTAAGCSSSNSSSSTTTPASGTSTTASSAAAAQQFPVTVTAANGVVTIKAQPSRIVSLSPTATEDLYAVGAGPQVVAVDADSNYPANAPVTKLSGLTPNIEAIARYNPSLVVTDQNVSGLVASLGKLGIPVLIEPAAQTLDDAYNEISQIGSATGHATQAAQVETSMKQQIAAAVAKAGAAHGGLTYYFEVSASPFYSATSKTFIGQVIGLFGLKNIADAADKVSDGGYPQLSQEYIVTAKPALIFLSDNQPNDGAQSPSVVAKRPGWDTVPAVKDGLVIPLNDDIASRWGPRLPQLVDEIAQAISKS